jgi:hypothetical protein
MIKSEFTINIFFENKLNVLILFLLQYENGIQLLQI